MKPARKTAQTTVKMTPLLQSKISEAASALGISSMEFIRRACEEKITGGKERDINEIRAVVIEVLKEEGLI